MVDFIDKTSTENGTPLNRTNMMAVQGFENLKITFEKGALVETNVDTGVRREIRIDNDFNVTEKIIGKTDLTKQITVSDGYIAEVIG